MKTRRDFIKTSLILGMGLPLAARLEHAFGTDTREQFDHSLAAPPPYITTPLSQISVASVPAEGEGLVTKGGKRFLPMGITYYRPDTGWPPQVWKQFDPAVTRRDFARLKALGGNCVRVFLSYASFCEKPGVLSPAGIHKFDEFLKLAEQVGLYVQPTGLDHWEGTPAWTRGDRYADEGLLQAQVDFWKQFAARYRHYSVLFAYELLNEPAIHWTSPAMQAKWDVWTKHHYGSLDGAFKAWHLSPSTPAPFHAPVPARQARPSQQLLDYQLFREAIADAWTQRQVKAIKSVNPEALVTVGLIQWSVPIVLAGPFQYSAFRPSSQARFLDFMEIHFYPLVHGVYSYGSPEEEAQNLAYLEGVVSQVARCNKPTVLAEFGWYGGGKFGRHPAATENQQARWCSQVIKTTMGLACGWLNWGLYDCPNANDVSRLTGLLKPDGTVKTWGRVFKQSAEKFRLHPPSFHQLGPRPTLDWNQCITDRHARNTFWEKYYKAYMSNITISGQS